MCARAFAVNVPGIHSGIPAAARLYEVRECTTAERARPPGYAWRDEFRGILLRMVGWHETGHRKSALMCSDREIERYGDSCPDRNMP